jgi:Tat protein translocase TatB subunit
MFGIGFDELLLILVIALIVVGPSKLPDIAKALGRAYAEFKRASNELKETLDQDETVRELKNEFNSAQRLVRNQLTFSGPIATNEPAAAPIGRLETPPSQPPLEQEIAAGQNTLDPEIQPVEKAEGPAPIDKTVQTG